jgi:hypothetical protein
MIHLV